MKNYMISRKLVLSFLLSLLALPPAGAQEAGQSEDEVNAIIVLDASGSMWGQVKGEAKIAIARRVIHQLVEEVPENVNLGLVAYGHRKKGECDDIQLLIDPAKVDKARFKEVVDNIVPKGMTPLTSAVEFAAENLAFKEQKASVILVSDGKETCERDPCEAAKKLEELGVDFTAHVVAFDLDQEDARSIECLAKETGGGFLHANDADTLLDALRMTLDEVKEEKEEKMEIKLDPATVSGPAEVPAGSRFKVTWEGPDNAGDYVTIVPKELEDGRHRNYSYTRKGSPLELTAIMDVGPAELRYMSARGSKVLGRADIMVTAVEASVKGPEKVVAGSNVKVAWTGPDNQGDYITIVSKETEEGKYGRYNYTRRGTPLDVLAPITPGACEIRYMSGQGGKVLARADIEVTKAEVTLQAEERCTVGNSVKVTWTGPANKNDYITIVPKDYEDGKYAKYEYTRRGSPLKVLAPVTAGECEIRYMTGDGGKVLARLPILVDEAKVILKAPETTGIGTPVSIEWSGPANPNDFISIVPKDYEDGKHAKYEYTRRGSPLKVLAPVEPGECEIRYMSGQGGVVFARRAITVQEAEVTIEAAEKAVVGQSVSITWTGPANPNDYLTIVPKDFEDGKYAKYTYTRRGNPMKVLAPVAAGECEIRYMTGQGGKVLARRPILIEAAEITLKAAEKAVAGEPVSIEWTGPGNPNDYITIVPVDFEDGKNGKYTYTRRGNPMKVQAPAEAGKCEIRYCSGQGGVVFARRPIEIIAGEKAE
ncbi:MAG: vWA domain-containing protein [Verrucomicrobiales bacterium]